MIRLEAVRLVNWYHFAAAILNLTRARSWHAGCVSKASIPVTATDAAGASLGAEKSVYLWGMEAVGAKPAAHGHIRPPGGE